VAFGTLPGIVRFADNLLLRFWPGRIGFVASQAGRVAALVDIILPRIFRMRIARPVTAFARKALVFMLENLLIRGRMAFLARFLARVDTVPSCQLLQRITSIPAAILLERCRSKEGTGDSVRAYYPNRQQEYAENLGRHLKKSAHAWARVGQLSIVSAFTIAYLMYDLRMWIFPFRRAFLLLLIYHLLLPNDWP
jgi:hypothetical protein